MVKDNEWNEILHVSIFNDRTWLFYSVLIKHWWLFIFQNLVNKKTKFFAGDSITMIDYMMWPWFERLEIFELKQ